MFITKMSLPRRTFLRGMGITVALPLLESMVPALTALAKTPAKPQRRLGCLYIPHGVIMEQWTPNSAGANVDFMPIMKPLEPFRESVVVVSNLARPEAGFDTNHAGAPASWLSGVPPKRTDGPDFRLGITIDQVVAKQIGQDTAFPSLEVATEDFSALIGSCAPGYSCAYANTLSWQGPTTPLPMEINPRVMFERMFGDGDTADERSARIREDKSVLDFVADDLTDLERAIGASDRARLGEYLGHIREVERRIQQAEQQTTSNLAIPTAPVGVPESFEEHVGLLFDLLALAYEADLTRVFTFMLARELSQRTYPNVDVTLPHHMISHHANNPERVAAHARVNTYHLQLFAKFLARLKATPDGDGSLLDHSMILYGSGMGNGNVHAADPLPLAIVGGLVKGNRHVVAPQHSPNANMMLSVADTFGVEMDRFGVSTHRIDL
ncbi:MAG: hypothetical protein C5B57_11995 [Blastocatellia bacterium]|nr:MAG: hypothetical protein C5B57_11995 [Blastocatellia bacterium]